MARLARGDKGALAALVQRHQQRIWAVAYRFTGRREDADDLTQEAFLRLWRGAASYRPTAQLSTWLYRIVLNLWVDLQRRREHDPIAWPPQMPDPSHVEVPVLEVRETADRVQGAVAALPERQRVVLVLHRYEGLSLKEIQASTGWSAPAIESLLSRAYAALRGALQDLSESSPSDRRISPPQTFNTQESV